MFDQEHLLPIACPKCGGKSLKGIGWLKDHDAFPCEVCGFVIQFESKAFARLLEQTAKTLDSEVLTNGFIHKPSQLGQ